jgi:FKBP-type peptidyl-prolyl cis-trans isomerase FkpA
MRFQAVLCLALASAFPMAACSAEPRLDTDEQKTIYALGAASAGNLSAFEFTPEETELMVAGLRDVLLGKKPRVNPQDFMPKIQAFVQARSERAQAAERDAAKAFLERAGKQPGASVKPSGLVYVEKKKGEGAAPAAIDTVKVHYRGTLRDGTEFDSSYKRNEPATFPLNGVIPCWTEALQLMRPGGTAEIYCPAAIAYGETGQGQLIRPGAALRFEVELLEVQQAQSPAQP